MNEYKSHKIRISSIPNGKCYCTIAYKSNTVKIIMVLAIILFLKLLKEPILCAPLVIYFVIYCLRKDRPLFKGYENFLILFDLEHEDYCSILYLNEIKSWKSVKVRKIFTSFIFILKSGEVIPYDCGSALVLLNYLKKVMPQKKDNE